MPLGQMPPLAAPMVPTQPEYRPPTAAPEGEDQAARLAAAHQAVNDGTATDADWTLVGGSSLSSEIELRLTERVSINDPDAALRVPPAMRGFRLVRKSD